MNDHPALVTIETYVHTYEADLAKIFLEAEGIGVYLADGNTIRVDWLLSNAIGNIKLQVRGDDADRARALLAAHKPSISFMKDKPPADFDEDACLACGKPMPADADACPACGWSFQSDEGSDADGL